MNKIVILLLLLFAQGSMDGQSKPFVSHPDQLDKDAYAEWIGPVSNPEEGVFYYRKKFRLDSVSGSFVVHTSADNRYRLYVNSSLVSWGPAVGDLANYNYETIDIAPFLKKGENIVSAQVWNKGKYRGERQISHQTAFILQGAKELEQIINSDRSWKVTRDEGYEFLKMTREIVGGGYIAGGTESLDGGLHPWGWKTLNFDDSEWENAKELGKGNHSGLDTWIGTRWLLKPRTIPMMEQIDEDIPSLIYVRGMDYDISKYKGELDIKIPANKEVEILLDNNTLTMGFPQLLVKDGKGSKIKVQYQESLFEENGQKGNRDEWQGKIMKGYYDIFRPDGGERLFQPLWIRVFRYVKITIETDDEPVKIRDFHNIFTAYPLEQNGSFSSDIPSLEKIWDVSWRTARLCALETYMDCPYYEQVQYVGDTRIQALISLYVDGNDLLTRNAIQQFYGSMQPMGLTKSNHPSHNNQIIPPFSLYFILMVHDYNMLRNDEQFVKQFIPGIRFILDWFVGKIADNGILGPLPYWNHIDGGTSFTNGSPPGISEGGSAHMSILLAYTIDHAAELFNYYGYKNDALHYKEISTKLKENTFNLCYDNEKQLVAETPRKLVFSQHTNSFAVLADLFNNETEKKRVAQRIIHDQSLVQATLYFKFYVFQALKKAGLGDQVIPLMGKWEEFLDYGLTTFPEHGINSRSDSHAWSAHPIYDLLSIVAGVEPSSPGFGTIRVAPDLGNLKHVKAEVPHPLGTITLNFKTEKDKTVKCLIVLPEGLTGKLIFDEEDYPLNEGVNRYNL
ncbi:alpha-L-rhamnosidase C-terminal domain-containing protein [Zunongwangia sp. F260]|uniref:Alpha-L-rhamnosidase C-terminal domain-containing protein n=1 Tax=Autumnicola lenta TaxID=3075593 RepID=A0ABU3CNY7_9FLAO|nr:alpha-L-rhamnosidase C-terminal domain-containing protein [Zunongwangia sp. F260]MDT0648001.1 alpha-L-rhamnosidase C-terminal domain-containing protein [Zunongwangia sp. F260]